MDYGPDAVTMRSSPIITSTNAGELSPYIDGRTDIAKYANGARRIENFLPMVQGPAIRRGGSRFVKEAKTSANRSWLVKFEYSATQAYVIEFGNLYCRFYTLEGWLESAPSVPYEIVSPYATADLTNTDGTCALAIEQSGDVLYIANQKRTIAPYKLTRLGTLSWAFTVYQPNQGPFLEENTSATTLYASASTGAVTITASAATFVASDVGRLVRLEVQNLDVLPWETGKAYAVNDLVRYDGKTYKAINAATSGTSPPIHLQGKAYDGKTGVQWSYQDAGYGLARISVFTSTTVVTANVVVDTANGLAQLPAGVVAIANITTRWALGAWSTSTEYPGSVSFFRSRLVWGGRQRLWASVPNDFENMAGDFYNEVRTDNAIWSILPGSEVNEILWLSATKVLMIGTPGGEFSLSEITTTEALGPANVKIERQSKYRVRAVQPVPVGNSLLYVQRAGRKLLSIDYEIQTDGYVSNDMAILSNRITRSGITAMAWQGEPASIVWCVLANGGLVGLTYDKAQEVTGWHRHPIGGNGAVESVVIIPSPDGDREQVWLQVRRTINGVTKRYVEFFESPFEGNDLDGVGGDDQTDAFYVDSGLTYSGASATTITGLNHLEGETVQILGDGAVQPSQAVTGGQITLARAVTKAQIGLQFIAKYIGMRLDTGGGDGTSQGKIKRIDRMAVRFIDTAGGKVGQYGGRLDDISLRDPSTPMDDPEPIASRDVNVDFPGDYDTDACIEIRQEQPLPMTIAAIMPRMRTYT
jgi:hypothetical protein